MKTLHFPRDNVEYPILFDLDIADAVKKRYGGMSEVVALLQAFDRDTTVWLVHQLINEGVLYRNDLLGTHDQPPSEAFVRRLITLKDMSDPVFITAVIDAFNEFTGGNADGQTMIEAGLEMLTEAQSLSKFKTVNGTTSQQATTTGL